MSTEEIVIVGGGVIGLSIAYALAREGVRSTLLDKTEVGRGASWAGAGLIPSPATRTSKSPMVELRNWSTRLYPEWSQALRDETGIDNGFRRCGGLDVAFTLEEENEVKTSAGRWRVEGIHYERLTPAALRQVEPELTSDLRAAWFLPDRSQIRNPRHLRALATACEQRGVTLRPDVEVLEIEHSGTHVQSLKTSIGTMHVGSVIIAAGAWTGQLLSGLGINVPTPPLRGQMLLFQSPEGRRLLTHVVEWGKNYLVPRDDGRILVGATEEDVGFDSGTTDQGQTYLMGLALKLCPALAEAKLERAWSGLRPGSKDTRPYLGLAPQMTNLYVASGHKRAGLQLSPATAEAMTDLVLGRPPRIDLSAFRLDREGQVDEVSFRS